MSRYQELIAEAEDIHAKRQTVGWDGYDGEPITKKSLDITKIVINNIPSNTMHPEISPICTGGYSLSWRNKKYWLVCEIENMAISISCLQIHYKIPIESKSIHSQHAENYYFSDILFHMRNLLRDHFNLNRPSRSDT